MTEAEWLIRLFTCPINTIQTQRGTSWDLEQALSYSLEPEESEEHMVCATVMY
jgi:hypothetical protein